VDVARAGSYQDAAGSRELADYRPLMRKVKRLAHNLDKPDLLTATQRGKVALTPAGAEILPAAQWLVQAADALLQAHGVRFSAFPSIASQVVTACHDLLDADDPLVLTDIGEGSRDDGGVGLVRKVEGGALDIAIAPEGLSISGLKSRLLYDWRLRVVLPARGSGGTLSVRKELSPDELVDFEICAAPPGHSSRHQLEDAFRFAGVDLRVVIESTNQAVLRELATSGRRYVAVIPDDAFGRPHDQIGPELRGPDGRTWGGSYAVYWRRADPLRQRGAAHEARDATIDEYVGRMIDSFAATAPRRT
jgi:DNA-binding transcriptional LysR family regulator